VKTQIGPYRIEQPLDGGMGVVYKAFDEGLNRYAILKTLKATDAKARARLECEAQAQARLQHPNVVTVYGLVPDGADLFIAMEYVDGRPLSALLDGKPAMELAEAMEIFGQILDALEFVHTHDVVHRDVKPSNVMISGGRVKLTDFGIATMTDIPRHTTTLSGTPPYMSPEQFDASATVDRRADIYSAAIVLFQMLSGRLPFDASSWHAHAQARLLPPPHLATFVPDLPAGVCDAVAIALQREPARRFDRAAEFKTALLEGRSGFLHTAPPPPPRSESEIPTEPFPVEPAAAAKAEERESSPATLLWIVSVTVVVLSMIAAVPLFRAKPVAAPAPRPVTPVVRTETVFVAVPGTSPPQPQQSAVVPPPPPKPLPGEQPVVAKEDDAAERRRQVDQLRAEIDGAVKRAEAALEGENFDAVQQEIDAIGGRVQRFPDDLRQEADVLRRLTKRLNDARVAAQTRDAREAMQAAMWQSKLNEIQQLIDVDKLPEAKSLAEKLIANREAPEPIVGRARELLQKSLERMRAIFKDAPQGDTKNTIRKPSSPPRN